MSQNYKYTPAAIRGRYSGGGIVQRLEIRPDRCTNTLTSVQKDNVLVICPVEKESQMTNNNSIYVGNVNPSGRGMNGAVYDSAGISPTLTTNKGEGIKIKMSKAIIYDDYNRRIKSDQTCIGTVMPNFKNDAPGNGTKLIVPEQQKYRVRKLTPKECWRLMGFEDSDFENARKRMNENLYKGNDRSSSQLYKQAGNSIVVDVLLHVMENLYDAMPYLFDGMVVGSFFSGIGAFEKALTRLQTEPHEYSPISKEDMPNLQQVGYINDYNGDANRVYSGDGVSRTLKADAGGVERKQDGTRFPARPNRSAG